MFSSESARKKLDELFYKISIENPRDRCLSILSACERKERIEILADCDLWRQLLCKATSAEFKHHQLREMDAGEIGELYYLIGTEGVHPNPLDAVLERVRKTYLSLKESGVLARLEMSSDDICDCFFIILSLYHDVTATIVKKCDALCRDPVEWKSECEQFYFCSTSCGAIYDAFGKHYGVSFFSRNCR